MKNNIYNQPDSPVTDHSSESPFVFVILLVFNNSEDAISCLKSLKEQTFSRFKVVMVDNASNQEHLDNIMNYAGSQDINGAKITILKNEKNLGYSGGNNIGIEYALHHGADYVLILNPDTLLEKTTLSEMMRLGKDNKVGIIGPTIDEGDREITGGKISWLKPELKHITSDKPDFLTGACLLVKREVFEKVGIFDKRYFLYFEDADLCVRTKKAGYELIVAQNAKLHHKVSATTSKLGTARLLRYHYRNAHIFNMKNAPLWAFILLPFWSIGIIIKQSIKIIACREKLISKEILLGVIDFYRGNLEKI